MTENETRTCPFCNEDIKAEAIKCKHCHSKVAPDHPDHGGVCPFCKEDVKPEAVKCKHCGSQISDTADTTTQSCSCSDTRQYFTLRRLSDIERGTYGQECFYNCYDYMRREGNSDSLSHRYCESFCEISMPPQRAAMVFYR